MNYAIHMSFYRHVSPVLSLVDSYDEVSQSCENVGATSPDVLEYFNMSRTSGISFYEELAVLWAVAYSNALASSSILHHPLHVVRFEDIMGNPEDASLDLFSRLGFPLGVKHISNISRIVSSFHRANKSYTFGIWKVALSSAASKRISTICCPLMEKFGYSCD